MGNELQVEQNGGGSVQEFGQNLPVHESGNFGAAGRTPLDEAETGQWKRYVAAILRYKWLIAAITICGTSLAVVATRFVSPSYLAQATVWIQRSGGDGFSSSSPIQAAQLLESASWIELLKSYRVLDTVVLSEQLYVHHTPLDENAFADFRLHPETGGRPGAYELSANGGGDYTLRTAEGLVVERGTLGDSIGTSIGFMWNPDPASIRTGVEIGFAVSVPRDVSIGLGQGLNTQLDRAGNILRVEFTGPNPEETAQIVNAVVEQFVTVAGALKGRQLDEMVVTLEGQLETAEEALQQAELEKEQFSIQNITEPSENSTTFGAAGIEVTRDPIFEQFYTARLDREDLASDRRALVRALSTPDSTISVAAMELIPSVQGSSELSGSLTDLTAKRTERRALLSDFNPVAEPVVRLDEEIQQLERVEIPQRASILITEIDERIARLDSTISAIEVQLRDIPPRAMQEARLQRNVDIQTVLFQDLSQRYENAKLAQAGSVPDVSILDRAVAPQNPFRNTASRLIIMGFVGSLGMAVVGALILDRIDGRVRYPEQVTQGMGLTILGTVPRVRSARGGSRPADVRQVVEALRGVRLNVTYAHGSAGPLVFTVTSPGSGDGKSFVSSNLALSFAEAGHRTLLIDADVRRGHLETTIGGGRKPGLTDFLEGRISKEKLIQKTNFKNLSFIGGGTRSQHSPELLGSSAMASLINSLRSSYGVIIVDTAPLGAGVDPFALGTLTYNMLLVLRTGTTDRELATSKLEILDRLPIRLLGAVLNDVKSSGVYRYYSYYMPGYESTGEGGELELPNMVGAGDPK